MNNSTNLKTWLVISIFLLGLVSNALGDIIYVDANTPDNNDGSNWGKAYKYLQDALAVAVANDEIWVADGTYKPDENTANPSGTKDRTEMFQLINGVEIYGGFPSGGMWQDRDPNEYETILSGDLNGDDVGFTNNAENSYHVVTGSGTDATAILDGFTITAGNANSSTYPDDRGAGMLNYDCNTSIVTCNFYANSSLNYGGGTYNCGSSPRLADCNFSSNSATLGGALFNWSSEPNVVNCSFNTNSARGGAVYNCEYSYPIFSYCMFNNNSGDYAGAVFSQDSNSSFLYCDFNNNSASKSAGAIYNVRSSTFLKSCWFKYNNATDAGGAIYNWDNSSPNLTDCFFIENRCDKLLSSDAGAIKNSQNSNPSISKCTFYQNSCGRYGGAIYNYNNSNPILQNCTFEDNTAYNGGGIANWDSSPTISNCCFIDNEASSLGGGLFNTEFSNPVLKYCTFAYNYAATNGGGLENWYDCASTVTNCIFYRNAAGGGAGMHNQRSNTVVTNCIFNGNIGSSFPNSQGAGMSNVISSQTVLVNCTFAANIILFGSTAGIRNDSDCTLQLTNCILWANKDQSGDGQSAQLEGGTIDINYSHVQNWNETLGGVGNSGANPIFKREPNDGGDGWTNNPDTPDVDEGANDDYGDLHLDTGSLCIDAGDNSEPNLGATDLDGRPRIIDGDCNDTDIVDTGAYEFAWLYIGDFAGGCDVDFVDFSILALTWLFDEQEAGYDPNCDISLPADGYIDWRDLDVFTDNWLAGKK